MASASSAWRDAVGTSVSSTGVVRAELGVACLHGRVVGAAIDQVGAIEPEPGIAGGAEQARAAADQVVGAKIAEHQIVAAVALQIVVAVGSTCFPQHELEGVHAEPGAD